MNQADRKLAEDGHELARQDYARALAIDPVNDRAQAGLRQVEGDMRHVSMMNEARALVEHKDLDAARQKLGMILTERPTYEPARQLMADINDNGTAQAEQALAAAFRTPVSLEFRNAPLKQIFEVIARHSGLNFVFDKDVKTDLRASIFLKNSTVEAAVYYLLVTNQLDRQAMDGNTILVYPNIPAKQGEYRETTVKTFYLANAEAKNVANTLKTLLKSRDVAVDEKLNLLIVRDSPDAIKLASQLVALQDMPEPEVVLDVEVLEVQRNRLLDLGVDWPTSLQFAPLSTASGTSLTIDDLRHLKGSGIGVTGVSAGITASSTDGDANLLAAPRIRVRNHEKAKVVIGDKLPTITTTISSGVSGFASESVNYVDVGLTLNVEPAIYLNNEVGIRISLEVSNLVDTIKTSSGSTAYRIGTRSAVTMLQLKDGENQVLAGLIKNEERRSQTKLPVLGELPLLGRLFGSQQDALEKTEVVLSITPHLVRNIQRPLAVSSEFSAGTEANFSRRPDGAARLPAQMPLPQSLGNAAEPDKVAAPAQPAVGPAQQNQGTGGSAPSVTFDGNAASEPRQAIPALSTPASAPAPSAITVVPLPPPSSTPAPAAAPAIKNWP